MNELQIPKFRCPKCNTILGFLGLTPNRVYEKFQCLRCKTKFLRSRQNRGRLNPKKPEDYTVGWQTEHHKSIRPFYGGKIPIEIKKEAFVFR